MLVTVKQLNNCKQIQLFSSWSFGQIFSRYVFPEYLGYVFIKHYFWSSSLQCHFTTRYDLGSAWVWLKLTDHRENHWQQSENIIKDMIHPSIHPSYPSFSFDNCKAIGSVTYNEKKNLFSGKNGRYKPILSHLSSHLIKRIAADHIKHNVFKCLNQMRFSF